MLPEQLAAFPALIEKAKAYGWTDIAAAAAEDLLAEVERLKADLATEVQGRRNRVDQLRRQVTACSLEARKALDERDKARANLTTMTAARDQLGCWCQLDEPCHADVLLELAAGAAGGSAGGVA